MAYLNLRSTGGLAKYDAAAFEEAGFPAFVRGRINQIAEHEATHAAFLKGALGDKATQPCTYQCVAGLCSLAIAYCLSCSLSSLSLTQVP